MRFICEMLTEEFLDGPDVQRLEFAVIKPVLDIMPICILLPILYHIFGILNAVNESVITRKNVESYQ